MNERDIIKRSGTAKVQKSSKKVISCDHLPLSSDWLVVMLVAKVAYHVSAHGISFALTETDQIHDRERLGTLLALSVDSKSSFAGYWDFFVLFFMGKYKASMASMDNLQRPSTF